LHSEDHDAILDDIPIKGCATELKDETTDEQGYRKFVVDHIRDYKKVLRSLEDAHLTLSEEKSAFGQEEILVIGHLYGPYGQRPSPAKVDAIQAMKEECESQSKVWRFLGACAFTTSGFHTMRILQIHSITY
jgi:hypothetical protein